MIPKDLFIKTMNAIEKQFKHDEDCKRAIKILFKDDQGFYDYSEILIALENILKEDMGDKESWIEYFIYELDFGKKWKETSITYRDSIIYMRNADELYEFLILNK